MNQENRKETLRSPNLGVDPFQMMGPCVAFQAMQGIASLSAIYFMAPPCVALGAKHGAKGEI
ncbi:hypothetical protein DDZ13_00605 [Coraliomargarita sinensis]|uniref:Uncharacterized protein n=1 Tax=Coraliomargarita sinensis TaxID=2174842 RepID=A0A317ZIQ3_9BACT|nr:hypothetical protein DDZ13_00605 [Coraliomargarita sinensis]